MTARRARLISESLARQFPPAPPGMCHACRGPLAPYRRRWCSDACADRYLALVDPPTMKRRKYASDPHCELCRCEVWVELREGDLGKRDPTEHERRFGSTAPVGFVLHGGPDGHGRYLAWRWVRDRERGDLPLAELDHRVPLVEGGEHSPDNLRLLCTPCHRGETAALAARRAERRRGARP